MASGKFVEFYGDGSIRWPLADRDHRWGVSLPEYGATCVSFPY